jgi:hypothetical protein
MRKVQEKPEIGLKEAIFIAFMILVALFMLITSYGRNANISLFPQVISSILLCLAVYRIIGMFIAHRRGVKLVRSSDDDEEIDVDVEVTDKDGTLNIYQSIALLVLYFALMYVFGFYIATFAYLVISQYLLKGLNLLKALIFAFVLTLLLYFTFKFVLVFMPKGVLFR